MSNDSAGAPELNPRSIHLSRRARLLVVGVPMSS